MMNLSFTLSTVGFIALSVFVCVLLHASDKNNSQQQLRKLSTSTASFADPRTVQTKVSLISSVVIQEPTQDRAMEWSVLTQYI
jgi:hypothetical protein